VTKTLRIIATTGDSGLLLPELVRDGLAANDRIKYILTLLQAAKRHAVQPAEPPADLRRARESCGIDDRALDTVASESRVDADGTLTIPRGDRLLAQLFDDTARMLEPLRVAGADDVEWRVRYDTSRRRLDAQRAQHAPSGTDRLAPAGIDALTAPGSETNDTLHRLVMDLHRALNAILAAGARESIDGASASGLADDDRPLVAAFMKGLNATAPLKLDHPGLATTAVRYRDHLSIQNDLGTTDGHVVVVQIAGTDATIVYSDLHARRSRFFADMLRPFAIDWTSLSVADASDFEIHTGRFHAADRRALEEFLTTFASRLVFLIDWNRARKRLCRLVKNGDAVAVLKWAADNDVGHRGFLQAGDVALIQTAFDRVAPARVRCGTRLDEVLGHRAAVAFLSAVLRITSVGSRSGHSRRLIQDEIEAELLVHLATGDRDVLDAAADHASLLFALADRVHRMIAWATDAARREKIEGAAALAKTWEASADEIVRDAVRRADAVAGASTLVGLLVDADEIADALEESAFLLTLLPATPESAGLAALERLAIIVDEAVREYVRCLEHARACARGRTRGDVDEALISAERIAVLEHACDRAERDARALLYTSGGNVREQQLFADIARTLEEATDAIVPCARAIRDYVLHPQGLSA